MYLAVDAGQRRICRPEFKAKLTQGGLELLCEEPLVLLPSLFGTPFPEPLRFRNHRASLSPARRRTPEAPEPACPARSTLAASLTSVPCASLASVVRAPAVVAVLPAPTPTHTLLSPGGRAWFARCSWPSLRPGPAVCSAGSRAPPLRREDGVTQRTIDAGAETNDRAARRARPGGILCSRERHGGGDESETEGGAPTLTKTPLVERSTRDPVTSNEWGSRRVY